MRRLVLAMVLALLPAGAAWASSPPPVRAAAYIVVDPATGETLASRAPDRPLPMASTTKVMTALITLERAKLDDVYTVPEAAAEIGESTGDLEDGERLTVRDLLTALLVPSGNDAAITLAVGVAGSQAAFVRLMNQKARELGMTETHYANPHGLDAPGHHTSVRDLVTVARAAMRYPLFRRIVGSRTASIPGPGDAGIRSYESENELLDVDPDADGIKTGMTDGAGYALVAHAERSSLGIGLYAAMIGSPSSAARAHDAAALLDWGFSHYARATLVPREVVLTRAAVRGRPGVQVDLRAARPLGAALRIGGPGVTRTLEAPPEVVPPVRAGEVLGTVVYRQGERTLGRRDLVAAEDEGGPGLWDRVRAGWDALVP
jgi:serine-type D-Ala-D-Ala carboxypeptidase (penicillin-binding protein 5/6)